MWLNTRCLDKCTSLYVTEIEKGPTIQPGGVLSSHPTLKALPFILRYILNPHLSDLHSDLLLLWFAQATDVFHAIKPFA